MRSVGVLFAATLLVWAGGVMAQCPGDAAAEQGHGAFETFHHVIAPAWHHAYPDEDYDALIAAGPEFKKAFLEIQAMRPEFKSDIKKSHFNECRVDFGEIVDKYAEACAAGDKETVFALMPDLHTAFERTAAALMPVHYKEFEALKVTLGLITDEHLPANNTEGIVGSTETLVTKAASLNEETLPGMLVWSKEDIIQRFQKIQTLAARMKECCDNNDMAGYAEGVTAMKAEVTEFSERYL
ncbi:hypothetical protein KQH82_12100 [bacterium]|nr:hypothetical protein [bacterium]